MDDFLRWLDMVVASIVVGFGAISDWIDGPDYDDEEEVGKLTTWRHGEVV